MNSITSLKNFFIIKKEFEFFKKNSINHRSSEHFFRAHDLHTLKVIKHAFSEDKASKVEKNIYPLILIATLFSPLVNLRKGNFREPGNHVNG